MRINFKPCTWHVPGILFRSLTSWSWGLWLPVWRLRQGTWLRTPLLSHTVDTWLYTHIQAGTETVKIHTTHLVKLCLNNWMLWNTNFFGILTLTVVLSNQKCSNYSMEIFIFFLWYRVWNCLPGFEPYFFWTFGDREQCCTRLHGPLPLAPSSSNPPRWTQQSYPLHTWKIRDKHCYYINSHLCYVQYMKSKFIVMCSTSKNIQLSSFL